MANVQLKNIGKSYPNGFKAIHSLNLEVHDGELLVLVGPSGCGKSTALRMIAGLEGISDGELSIGPRIVNKLAPKDRDIAMVFQSYALYPHMTVYDNIGFSLKMAKMPSAEADKVIREAARILELDELLERKPGQLSGGQRQRVAMGRAIVRKPSVFLMDEPLSNLDAKLRVQMRAEIARLQDRLGVTTIYVTHDQVEAMTMGDRVAVMKSGYLQQVDTPKVIYDRPENVFVAAFIGSPSMNLFEGDLHGTTLTFGSHSLQLPQSLFAKRPGLQQHDGHKLIIGIRPEEFEDARLVSNPDPQECIQVTMRLVEELGSDTIVHFGIDAPGIDPGDPDAVKDLSEGDTAMVGRLHRTSTARSGDKVKLAVSVGNIHFFDPKTRLAIW